MDMRVGQERHVRKGRRIEHDETQTEVYGKMHEGD